MKFLLLIMVAALITGASSRKQRARRQAAGKKDDNWQREILKELLGNDSLEEAWPGQPAPTPTPAPTVPAHTATKPATKPTYKQAKHTHTSPSVRTKNTAIGEIAGSLLDNAVSRPAPTAESISEDFDLRRAVIYSEILRPKFED